MSRTEAISAEMPRSPGARAAVAATAFGLAGFLITEAHAQSVPDMVSRTALRVCADPSYLPYSNKKHDGFENKVAEIIANELKEPVRYFWAPSGPGWVRNTLSADMCDIIMGYTVGAEMVQSTNPYYRSTYVLVAPKGSQLNGIETLDDPKLKGHHFGVFAATPPVDELLKKNLLTNSQVYPLIVDHRYDSPLNNIVSDLESGKIDAALVWGPLIGSAVKASDGKLVMTPLLKDANKPNFSYRITFGVRHDETDWKHKLEGVIRRRHADINKVLADYNVPLLDNSGNLIPPEAAVTEKAPKIEPAATGERNGRTSKPSAGFKMPGPAPTNGPAPSNP